MAEPAGALSEGDIVVLHSLKKAEFNQHVRLGLCAVTLNNCHLSVMHKLERSWVVAAEA